MEIKYEDIVRDQKAASRQFNAFLGLPWDDEVLRFHESPVPSATASAVQVRRPIYSSLIGKWRHHAKRLTPLRARIAREIPEDQLARGRRNRKIPTVSRPAMQKATRPIH
jgi:hypothetical protein